MKTTLALMAVMGTALASDVIVGTTDNFDEVIKEGLVLVEFYAPWCGHCKKLAPEWETAATELAGKAKLVMVDATIEDSLGTKYAVQGYPTIKLFMDGEPSDYEGGRTAPEIVSYVLKISGPAVRDLADAAALEALREQEKSALVGFFASADDKDAQAFAKLAKQNRMKFVFAAVYDSAIAKAEGASVPGLIVFKNFDEKKDVMAEYKLEEVIAFASAASFPVVDEIGPDNYKDYVERGLPIGWLFLDDKSEDESAAVKAVLSEACVALKGKLSCVYLSGTQYGQMAERIGLSATAFPSFGIDAEDEKFLFEQEVIEAKALTEFLTSWAAGSLVSKVKSAPAPEEHTVDGLTTLVGLTFKDLAVVESKNVLIKFYAPWCGHCKSMAPDYAKLAADFANDDDVMIADFDATTNDAPKGYRAEGFPTLFFIKKGSTTPEDFGGGRDYDSMKKWVDANRV